VRFWRFYEILWDFTGFCEILKILRDSEDSMRFLRFCKDSEDSDKILARVYEDSGELPTPAINISQSLGISRLPVRFFKMTVALSKAHLCYCCHRGFSLGDILEK
jgi:hypothetical protein